MEYDEIVRAILIAGALGEIYATRGGQYSGGGVAATARIAVSLADAALDEMHHKPYHPPKEENDK